MTFQQQQKKSVKVFLDGDVKRFKVESFNDLKESLKKLAGVNVEEQSLFYLDEEHDWVSFQSEEEFLEAMEFHLKPLLKIQCGTKGGPARQKPWFEKKVPKPSGLPVFGVKQGNGEKHKLKIDRLEGKIQNIQAANQQRNEKQQQKVQNMQKRIENLKTKLKNAQENAQKGRVNLQEKLNSQKEKLRIQNEKLKEKMRIQKEKTEFRVKKLQEKIELQKQRQLKKEEKLQVRQKKLVAKEQKFALHEKNGMKPARKLASKMLVGKSEAVESPAIVSSEEGKKLEMLACLGLNDSVLNIKVLRENGGDLQKTLKVLLKN